MIDVKAFGGDPMIWSRAVYLLMKDMGVDAYTDSYGGYITAKSKGWKRDRFPVPHFSDLPTVRAALIEYVA